jgi:UDP-arabinose 4-epimerase
MGHSRRTVLVTGGAGYIGSHTCKALARAGYLPVVYDNLLRGHEWAVKWGPLEKGDIRDRAKLSEVFARYKPATVLHFAGLAYVGESVADPGPYYDANVAGSLALVETMREHGSARIVFSSTCATYGTPDQLPIDEETPQKPINPYGASKLMVERILADFERAHGIHWTALRYFNVAGADLDGELGESHDPETHLVPLVLRAASGGQPAVSVFGTDYDTTDGTCIRDYIHVADLAAAHTLALRALEEGAPGRAYNLGIGRGFSVREVIAAAERITGLKVPFSICARRPGDPAALVSDAAKAREELGWRPEVTDLDAIIRSAWAWHERGPPDPLRVRESATLEINGRGTGVFKTKGRG